MKESINVKGHKIQYSQIKKDFVLTVSGLGSSILRINDVAPGENQNGHEKSAVSICTPIRGEVISSRPQWHGSPNAKMIQMGPVRKIN